MILRSLVKSQSRIRNLRYITSGEHCDRVRIIQAPTEYPGAQVSVRSFATEAKANGTHEDIVFQVNTPTFYSRFFHYRSPFAAIESELLDDDERTRTVWSSHPYEFAALFPHDKGNIWREPLDWRWRIISMLRSDPIQTNFPRQTVYEPCNGVSLTDNVVAQHCSDDDFRAYRRALIRNFLGHWMGGLPPGFIKEGDFELIGLSRDAVLRALEAFLKVAIVTWAISSVGNSAVEATNTAYPFITMLNVTGLNFWACLKSSL